jgi:hypothetical protein
MMNWKDVEAVIAYFKVLSQNLTKTTKKKNSWSLGWNLKLYEAEVYNRRLEGGSGRLAVEIEMQASK